jgi:hypothetical protein
MSQESLEDLLLETAGIVGDVRLFAEQANCGELDSDLFFNTEYNNQLIPMEVLKACLGCKVRVQCLERIEAMERHGRASSIIFGGMKGSAREKLLYSAPKRQWSDISKEYIEKAIARRKNYRDRKKKSNKK